MIKLNYSKCGFSKAEIAKTAKRLVPRIKELQAILKKQDFSDNAASILLPKDRENLVSAKNLAKEFKDAELIVVVGIGGSNLGTVAVYEAVKGKLYNMRRDVVRLMFADSVDSDSVELISQAIKYYLAHGRKVLVNAISKSGMTTETIANFQVFLKTIQQITPHKYKDFIAITTDEGSELDELAKKMDFKTIHIPKQVGGRYSAFSSVGLLPLAVAGIDIEQLLKGATDGVKSCLNTNVLKNPAAIMASLMYLHSKNNRNVHDHFVWSNDLESVGKWYRQLLGESIGKKKTVGITPTVSVGSTDLHSVGQLYLGGPDDKSYRFITVSKSRNNVVVPKEAFFDKLVKGIQGKSLDEIMQAIIDGVKKAFARKRLPFIEINLPEKSAYHIGQLLQTEMIEVMLLGHLFDVNPFNQPNVEDYKKETRKILERS